MFLFYLVCLKYFINLKYTKIKRLCGRPRLPVWVWPLDTQIQTKGRCCQSCLEEEFCCLGSRWQAWATCEHLNGHGFNKPDSVRRWARWNNVTGSTAQGEMKVFSFKIGQHLLKLGSGPHLHGALQITRACSVWFWPVVYIGVTTY